jgi:hypothetical protein
MPHAYLGSQILSQNSQHPFRHLPLLTEHKQCVLRGARFWWKKTLVPPGSTKSNASKIAMAR